MLLFVWCFLSFLAAGNVMSYDVPLIPLEQLFGNPTFLNPKVSPDGKYLAYIAPFNNVNNIWIRTLGKHDDKVITHDTGLGITNYRWSYSSNEIIFFQDQGGNENWRLYVVNVKTASTKCLTPFENSKNDIVKYHKKFPRDLIIESNKRDLKCTDLYKLNLDTGELTLIAENDGFILSWFIDNELRLRGMAKLEQNGSLNLLLYEDETLIPIKNLPYEDVESFSFIGFSSSNKDLYWIHSSGANISRLLAYVIDSKTERVLAEDCNYDIHSALQDVDKDIVLAALIIRDHVEFIPLDKQFAKDVKKIKKVCKAPFTIQMGGGRWWTITVEQDTNPISYWIYDRETKKLNFLFDSRPELTMYQLAPMKLISFKARDGLTIQGYITLPLLLKKTNPCVVVVHGGPWARDCWGYNSVIQLLANRGYIVLQINYRGSTGYGKKFVTAGDREWAGKMHTDILDGLAWAQRHYPIDKTKIGVFGGSYGGYEALVCATQNSDIFACAVDIVGPCNLLTLLATLPPYWTPLKPLLYKQIGNPETEPEFLKERSPLFKADKIKIPLLIAQGKNDPRVKETEAQQIVEALKKHSIPHTYYLFEGEGHGLRNPENNVKLFKAIEEFFACHLQGQCLR